MLDQPFIVSTVESVDVGAWVDEWHVRGLPGLSVDLRDIREVPDASGAAMLRAYHLALCGTLQEADLNGKVANGFVVGRSSSHIDDVVTVPVRIAIRPLIRLAPSEIVLGQGRTKQRVFIIQESSTAGTVVLLSAPSEILIDRVSTASEVFCAYDVAVSNDGQAALIDDWAGEVVFSVPPSMEPLRLPVRVKSRKESP
ncbi:MAG: hypothetical protein SFV23_05260 [Planctomycetaceae bacterium]|nr:hypothetical protein [Planctomycetaceae bacterium]